MSLWWLVVDDRGHTVFYYTRDESGPFEACSVLEAALMPEEAAKSLTVKWKRSRAVNAAVHIRSLGLPRASTVTVPGIQGTIKGTHEALGPVLTMVDMLEGSPMAAALRVESPCADGDNTPSSSKAFK